MHNLFSEPKATGVRQIYKLRTKLQTTWNERKSVESWLGLKAKVDPHILWALALQAKQTWLSFTCKGIIKSHVCLIFTPWTEWCGEKGMCVYSTFRDVAL